MLKKCFLKGFMEEVPPEVQAEGDKPPKIPQDG